MASRSLNKVQLIGNLTRDPELRYTPQGTAVCTFGVATNRSWTTEDGERHEDTEFHTIVAWTKLAEICAEFLSKGRQVYVEGRLSTREWEDKEGSRRRTTEVVATEVIFLGGAREELSVPEDLGTEPDKETGEKPKGTGGDDKTTKTKKSSSNKAEQEGEDIPF